MSPATRILRPKSQRCSPEKTWEAVGKQAVSPAQGSPAPAPAFDPTPVPAEVSPQSAGWTGVPILPMSRQGRPWGLDFLSLSPRLGEEGHVPQQAAGSLGVVDMGLGHPLAQPPTP